MADGTRELKPERKPHKCWVQASAPEEALTVAADLMVREVEELRVLSSRGTSYSVGCLISDVELTFSVSRDMMNVAIKSIQNVDGARDLSIMAVRRQLQISGVLTGLVDDGISKVVEVWLSKGEADTTTVLAVGRKASQTCSSSVQLLAEVLDRAVFSGDEIGILAGPTEAKSGMTVFGVEIEPEAGDTEELVLGFGVEARGDKVVASVYGEVKYTGTHLSITPGFVLCERELQVTMDLFPFSLVGQAVTMASLKAVFSDAGVLDQFVDLDHIREKLKEVWQSGEPIRGVVAAKGVEPVVGAHGSVELTRKQGKGGLPSTPKTVLGVWHPRIEPKAGTNLFGVQIAPEALEKTTHDEARCGTGVVMVGNEFVSSGFGIVRLFGSYVDLTPIVAIAEDGLTAVMDVYPFDSEGVALEEESFLKCLSSAGVVDKFVDRNALEAALLKAKKSGSPINGITVATGSPPEEAWATEYLFREGLGGRSVLKGEELVEILKGAPSKPGVTVTGESIEIAVTRLGGGSLDLSGACVVSKDGSSVVSTEYGQVHFSPTSVSVEPGLTILNEGNSALFDLYPDHLGGALSIGAIVEILLDRGVVRHRIEDQSILAALKKMENGAGAQKGTLVAASVNPEAGSPPTTHIREPSVMVYPSERVAWVTKSSDSVNGEDIFGKRLIADIKSMSEEIVAGPFIRSVEVDSEKEPNVLMAFQSTALGRMTVEQIIHGTEQRSVLSVSPSLRFSGKRTSCWMELSSTHLDGSPVLVREVEAVLLGMGFDSRVVCRSSIQRIIDAGGGEALVAKSVDWQQPSDWMIQSTSQSENEALFPGDMIATVVAGKPAVEGYDLEGKPVATGRSGPGISLCAGSCAVMHEDGLGVLSTTYGHAVVDGLLVRVLPGMWVSSDKMAMYLNVFPKRVGGEAVTLEDFQEMCSAAGLLMAQFDEETVSAAIDKSQKRGRPEWNVCAAKGVSPTAGVNGSLEEIGDLSKVAFAGDPVVRVIPEKEGTTGLDVYGVELPVPFQVTPVMVSPEGGCRVGSDGCIEADVYGRVYVDGSRVIVQPAIHFSPDKLSLSLDIYKHRTTGDRVTQEDILKVLEGAKIVEQFIDGEAILSALRRSEDATLDVVVATGEAPVLGSDGALRLEGDVALLALSGDLVASFDPHTPPILGRSVDGEPISPNEEPSRTHLIDAEGVTLSPDLLQATAGVAGYVEVLGDSVGVTPAITFSDDKMECRMDLTSERFGGGQISVEEIVEELTKQGVSEVCVDRDAITLALDASLENGGVTRVLVARGIPSTLGGDGSCHVVEGLENGALFSGDEILHITPPVISVAGHDVLGNQIAALAGVKRLVLVCEGGIELAEEGTVAIAHTYGSAEVVVGPPIESNVEGISNDVIVTVRFRVGIILSTNRLDCYMDLFPHSAVGGNSGLTEMVAVLKDQEVLERFVMKRVLTGAIKMAARMLQPQPRILVAKGNPPRHGVNGRIRLLDSKHPSFGNKRAFGRVDFKEIDTLVEVVTGDAVAKVTAPILGVLGETVTGEKIEAHDGVEVALDLGDGVEFRDGQIFAKREGVVSALGAKIDVVDLVTVDGDVDYRSGNVRVRSGCVRIKGSVYPGFRVSSPENIEIDGSVDGGARVEAGGHIVVRGAVVAGQKESTELQAGGDITIGVGRNATITAGGDVIIQKEALHCTIHTESRVIIERRPGVLSGGEIRAVGGVFTHQLGSAQWTPTTLYIGGETKIIAKLMLDLSKALQRRMSLNDKLDGMSDDELREQAQEYELRDVERLISQRGDCRRECFGLEEQLKLERINAELQADPMIEVRESIFPRVVINFGREQYKCETQVTRKRVFLDRAAGLIEVHDLSSELPDCLVGPVDEDADE